MGDTCVFLEVMCEPQDFLCEVLNAKVIIENRLFEWMINWKIFYLIWCSRSKITVFSNCLEISHAILSPNSG